MAMEPETGVITLEGVIFSRTDKAVLFGDAVTGEPVWLPLSQIAVDESGGDGATVLVPEWLAHDKGLI